VSQTKRAVVCHFSRGALAPIVDAVHALNALVFSRVARLLAKSPCHNDGGS